MYESEIEQIALDVLRDDNGYTALHGPHNKERIVDFGPFLQKSLNPMIRKYLKLDNFKNFTVEYGDLFWHDYDLCFPIADLYDGRI